MSGLGLGTFALRSTETKNHEPSKTNAPNPYISYPEEVKDTANPKPHFSVHATHADALVSIIKRSGQAMLRAKTAQSNLVGHHQPTINQEAVLMI